MNRDRPVTPDGRYFVSRGRLWRRTNPDLPEAERRAAIKALMQARLAIRNAADDTAIAAGRARVDAAKRTLGERGPVWWTDGVPDESGRAPWNSSYADWWHALPEPDRSRALGPDPD